MKNVCLIPARSGSKGLKDKNMAFLNNKPVLIHTIEAALESGIFDAKDIYVSTDSQDYINHIGDLGITLKYRDPNLAVDSSTTSDVVINFLSDFEGEDVNLVLLQPTSPLRTGKHIQEAFAKFEANKREKTVVSVCEVDKSPNLFTELGLNGELKDIVGVDKGYRRQNYEKLYEPNGAIYITTMVDYLATTSFFTNDTIGYVMDKKSSIDIDDYDDFVRAIGAIFFDYTRREECNREMYEQRFIATKDDSKNIILGDSRTEAITIDTYKNYSMGGVTAKTMLEIVKNNLECESIENVIINLGVNDIIVGYSQEDTKTHIAELVNLFPNANVVINNIFPTIYRPNIDNDKIVELNEFISRIPNVQVIDTYNSFEVNNKLDYNLTYDGLHLTSEGSNILKEMIERYI